MKHGTTMTTVAAGLAGTLAVSAPAARQRTGELLGEDRGARHVIVGSPGSRMAEVTVTHDTQIIRSLDVAFSDGQSGSNGGEINGRVIECVRMPDRPIVSMLAQVGNYVDWIEFRTEGLSSIRVGGRATGEGTDHYSAPDGWEIVGLQVWRSGRADIEGVQPIVRPIAAV